MKWEGSLDSSYIRGNNRGGRSRPLGLGLSLRLGLRLRPRPVQRLLRPVLYRRRVLPRLWLHLVRDLVLGLLSRRESLFLSVLLPHLLSLLTRRRSQSRRSSCNLSLLFLLFERSLSCWPFTSGNKVSRTRSLRTPRPRPRDSRTGVRPETPLDPVGWVHRHSGSQTPVPHTGATVGRSSEDGTSFCRGFDRRCGSVSSGGVDPFSRGYSSRKGLLIRGLLFGEWRGTDKVTLIIIPTIIIPKKAKTIFKSLTV